MVIIDVKPKDLGIPTEAYHAVEEIREASQHHGRLSTCRRRLGRWSRRRLASRASARRQGHDDLAGQPRDPEARGR